MSNHRYMDVRWVFWLDRPIKKKVYLRWRPPIGWRRVAQYSPSWTKVSLIAQTLDENLKPVGEFIDQQRADDIERLLSLMLVQP